MKLNSDGTVSIPAATLSTSQVEQLLIDLAKLRCQMTPAVPQTLKLEGNLSVQRDPALFVGRSADGDVTIGFRHEGFGWCTFLLPVAKAAQLNAFIAKRTTGQAVDFVDNEMPGGDQFKH